MAPRSSILVVGAGNMGGAIVARALARRGFSRLSFFDVDSEKIRALEKKSGRRGVKSLETSLADFDTVILAIKPQSLPAFLRTTGRFFRPGQLVITILAGVKMSTLSRGISANARVVRAMPNTPALVGAGITAVAGKNRRDVAFAKTLFSAMGEVVEVKEEKLNAVTALSGAGPAYVFRFIEALTSAGRAQGFPPKLAQTLVAETLKGALALWASTGEAPEVLRAKVTSPGGVTEAALKKMESIGFEQAIVKGVAAGVRRGKELNG